MLRLLREIWQRLRWLNKQDRIGPDVFSNHWKLHLKSTIKYLCLDNFTFFGDGTVELVNSPRLAIAHRQDALVAYSMATVYYVAKSKFLMTHNAIFDGCVKAVRAY